MENYHVYQQTNQNSRSLNNSLSKGVREDSSVPATTNVKKKDNSYDFQLTTNQEFLSDKVSDDIFELVIDSNFDLRQKIGDKIYFKHSFVGVRKYYVEDEEFDSLSSAYEEATKQLDGDWLTEEGLTLHQLIEIRDI